MFIYRLNLVPDLRMDYISPSIRRLTGYSPEDFFENPNLFFELIYPGGRRSATALIRDEETLGHPLTLRWVGREKEVIWVEQQNVPVHDRNGSLHRD